MVVAIDFLAYDGLSVNARAFRVSKVVQHIAQESRNGVLLMSVGCGTGLFEATLAAYLLEQGLPTVCVEGIEVLSAQTPYLPHERLHRVQGSWDIYEHAEQAAVLIFVYPRRGELVRRYLKHCHRSTSLVLWLGPRADWAEQEPILHNVATFGGPTVLKHAGLAQYELAILFKNTSQDVGFYQTAVQAEAGILGGEDISCI
ncbi:hypothetical protein LTR70_001052 [Exophiala xenobiotica]|nr:hypothetical protein LTR70_001052 [Exophiala xenobiotica]